MVLKTKKKIALLLFPSVFFLVGFVGFRGYETRKIVDDGVVIEEVTLPSARPPFLTLPS